MPPLAPSAGVIFYYLSFGFPGLTAPTPASISLSISFLFPLRHGCKCPDHHCPLISPSLNTRTHRLTSGPPILFSPVRRKARCRSTKPEPDDVVESRQLRHIRRCSARWIYWRPSASACRSATWWIRKSSNPITCSLTVHLDVIWEAKQEADKSVQQQQQPPQQQQPSQYQAYPGSPPPAQGSVSFHF